jgi:TonB family protein
MTLFDAKGKNPVDATIEYWKSGAETLRVITLGASTQTDLTHEGKHYRASSGDAIPALASETFDSFLHPGPMPADFETSKPELRKQSFGKISLDCIMLTEPLRPLARSPLGLFPTYCLASGADRLVASYDFGSREITIQHQGRFLDHDVAVELEVGENNAVAAKAKVLSLVTFTPAADTFLPGPELVAESIATARIGSAIVAGLKIGGNVPVYPVEARENHVSGTVTLHAVIGRDGHVHRLRVKSAPDPDLAISALAAVRTWTYKPYLLNGDPVEVDTTIIVNYSLGG